MEFGVWTGISIIGRGTGNVAARAIGAAHRRTSLEETVSRSRADIAAATYLAPMMRRVLTVLAGVEVAFYDALEAFSGYEEVAEVVRRPSLDEMGAVPRSAA